MLIFGGDESVAVLRGVAVVSATASPAQCVAQDAVVSRKGSAELCRCVGGFALCALAREN
jgi:hypothetical protein